MRKTLFATTIILLIVNFVSAQSTRVGFTAGPVLATMYTKSGGVTNTADYRVGATFGILLDVPMLKNGSFQPGVNYVNKGSKDHYTQAGQEKETKIHIDYIEVPLNVIFRIPGSGGNIILGGGPAAALAITGKSILIDGSSRGTNKLSFGDAATTDDYIGVDFGINGIAGYEFRNGFYITGTYNYGINRLLIGGDNKDKLYNRYIALRFGILIGGKK